MSKPTFNEWIASLGFRPLSAPWSALVKAILAEPMTDDDVAHYRRLSGGLEPSTDPDGLTRALIVAGRRANKSETIARLAVYEILFGGHEDFLAPGEVGFFAVVSPFRESGDMILNYAKGLCSHKSIKAKLQGTPTADEIVFRSGLAIKILTADSVSVRGRSLIGCCIEEAAFLDAVRGTPSDEIIAAIEPAMMRMGDAPPRRLLSITTAYIKSGAAWKTFKEGYAVPDAAWTVFSATTLEMNPAVPEKDRAAAERSAEVRYRREWLSEWQDSISTESYFGFKHIDASIERGRGSMAHLEGMRVVAAMDPALRGDAWALCVGWHRTTAAGINIVEIAHVESWQAPKGGSLDPAAVLQKIAALLRAKYECTRVYSDQFHSASLRSIARDFKLSIIEKPWTAGGVEGKAVQYAKVNELLRAGTLRLPHDPRLISELKSIRSKLLPSGVEQIQATGSGHDDYVSALVMCITEIQKLSPRKAVADLNVYEILKKEADDLRAARAFGSAGRFGW